MILSFCFRFFYFFLAPLHGRAQPGDVSALASSNPCPSQLQLTWTLPTDYNADEQTLLVFAATAPFQQKPTADHPYQANADLTLGSPLTEMGGAFCVFNGDANQLNIKGLTPARKYYFSVFNVGVKAGAVSKGSEITATTIAPITIDFFGKRKGRRVGTLEVRWASEANCGHPYFVFGHEGISADCRNTSLDWRGVDIAALTPEIDWSKRAETNDLHNFARSKNPDDTNYVLFKGEIGVNARFRVRGLNPKGGYHYHLFPSRWPFVIADVKEPVAEVAGAEADPPGRLDSPATDGSKPTAVLPDSSRHETSDAAQPKDAQPVSDVPTDDGQLGADDLAGAGQRGDELRTADQAGDNANQAGSEDEKQAGESDTDKRAGDAASSPLLWAFWAIIILFFFAFLAKRLKSKPKISFKFILDPGHQTIRTWPAGSSLISLPEIEIVTVVGKGQQQIREAAIIEAVDDLTRIEGIGRVISKTLAEAGILTFRALAASQLDRLRQILDKPNLGLADPGTWPQQAALAAAGDWEKLSHLQDTLKGGRDNI